MKPSDEKTRSERQRFINPWRRYVGSFVPNWLLCRHEVSAQAKLLYARLAQYAGQKGVAYPRQDTLARELGSLSERTVRRYVAELREHGLIHVEDRRNKNFPNKYKFLDHPWQHEGDVIDDDESPMSPPDEHRTELSSGTGGPQDKVVLSGQDKVVLSRRDSLEENHSQEENHTAGATRSGRIRARKPPKPPPRPKVFEDTPSLGSEGEDSSGEDPGEGAAKPAARPKARRRLTKSQKIAEEAAERAKAQVSANTQKRLKAAEVQEQRQKNLASKGPRDPGVRALEQLWYELMERDLPSLTIARWGGKERGQARKLQDKYGVQIALDALRYVVANWNGINERIFKGRASHPTIGMVLKLHETLVIEAQKWSQHEQTISEWEAWTRENPYSLNAPGDLDERYQRAMKELEALGIVGS